MNHSELLLEVGCEEIPARFVRDLSRGLAENLGIFLKNNRVEVGPEGIRNFFTPRRLICHIPVLAHRQSDIEETLTGPPKKVAFDEQGHATQAVRSFAEKSGVKVENLSLISTKKGDYVAVKKIIKGSTTKNILEKGLTDVILTVALPRSMYWSTSSGPYFIRPIRWVCCVFDEMPLHFSLGEIVSQRFTYGHRLFNPGKFAVRNFAEFQRLLSARRVLIDPEERRNKIENECKVISSKKRANHLSYLGLLETHICLSEYPTPLAGEFESSFLKLPQEILETVMRDHQKYFALFDTNGKLLPRFVAVMDNVEDRKGHIRRSHERVLRARFADAEFFWETDLKIKMEDRKSMLEKVVFQERLGSYAEKTRRVEEIAAWIAQEARLNLDPELLSRAVQLCKCDLTTQMVKEFPELQGIVGGLYAEAQGEPKEVSQAIYQHYQPETFESDPPVSVFASVISIADKLDGILGSFSLGHRPTGSKDPFGLRRRSYGILKVILEKSLSIDLEKLVMECIKLHNHSSGQSGELSAALLEFFRGHAEYIFENWVYSGVGTKLGRDEIAAVLSTEGWDLCDLYSRVVALNEIRKKKNFDSLAASFKRIKNIIKKSGVTFTGTGVGIDPGLFQQEEERRLHQQIQGLREKSIPLRKKKDYKAILEAIAAIHPSIDHFFDKVLVNTEDEAVRQNRFNLLLSLYQEFIQIADFSELQSADLPRP